MNTAAVDAGLQITIQVPAFSSFRCIPRAEIVGSYGNSLFSFLRTLHTACHRSWMLFHSLQLCLLLLYPYFWVRKPSEAQLWLLQPFAPEQLVQYHPNKGCWVKDLLIVMEIVKLKLLQLLKAIYKCWCMNFYGQYSSLPFLSLLLPSSQNNPVCLQDRNKSIAVPLCIPMRCFREWQPAMYWGCWFMMVSTCLAGWIHICNLND